MNCEYCGMYWMCKNCTVETHDEGDRNWGELDREED